MAERDAGEVDADGDYRCPDEATQDVAYDRPTGAATLKDAEASAGCTAVDSRLTASGATSGPDSPATKAESKKKQRPKEKADAPGDAGCEEAGTVGDVAGGGGRIDESILVKLDR